MSDTGKPSPDQMLAWRDLMENWMILEGWQAYNHADDQTWDQWGFSKDGKRAWFLFQDNNEITVTNVTKTEIAFPLSAVPMQDLIAMYNWAMRET